MTIVTGADSKYFHALRNLIGSIHYWAPDARILIFDLGLTTEDLRELSTFRNCELRWAGSGPPVDVTVRGERKRCRHLSKPLLYAWKPTAILQAVDETGCALWLDAGSDVRGPLDGVEELLRADGYFLVKGQDVDMTARLHTGCARRLGLRLQDFRGKPSFAGNTQGYVKDDRAFREILTPLYEAACDKRCIAPFLSSLRNHRYDQSILSLIAYSRDFEVKDQTHLLSADRADLSNDPKQPSERRIYTARGASHDYLPHLQRG